MGVEGHCDTPHHANTAKEGSTVTLEDLARRIQVVEDSEAIKKLKARYCA